MKNFVSIFIGMFMAVGVVVGLHACKDKNAPQPPAHVVVVKFKKPEYKNYILANYFKDEEDSIVAMRFNSCGEPIGQSGYSPYWELPDNWLLVDWKWPIFPYETGLTLLSEKTWDQYPVETHPLPRWPITEPHVFYPTEKVLSVPAYKLADYLHKTYSADIYAFMNTKAGEDGILCDSISEWADSIWAVIHRDISIVIYKGDLEEISKPSMW